MKEIWKDIFGYEGIYQVSNMGNVRSLINQQRNKRKKPKLRKLTEDQRGYLRIRVYKKGKGQTLKVHRLVAQTFIPNPENKPQVNHIDGNSKNNQIKNLEYM